MISISEAAQAIQNADALLISAGAGMGVDSGLPDFRGTEGFWKAYPHAQKLGLNFTDLANPSQFTEDKELAWGFYAHRASLYSRTLPHQGFSILRKWLSDCSDNGFVFTSNVDGHFAASNFSEDALIECHGSLRHLQCVTNCSENIWELDEKNIPSVDPETFRAVSELPLCPQCGGLARPNILMFGDHFWQPQRTAAQEHRFRDWLLQCQQENRKIAIIELGAGRAIPTVRNLSESVSMGAQAPLIRINPRDPESDGIADHVISIPLGALEAITLIDDALQKSSEQG